MANHHGELTLNRLYLFSRKTHYIWALSKRLKGLKPNASQSLSTDCAYLSKDKLSYPKTWFYIC